METEDYLKVKEMYMSLSLEEVKEDLSTLIELIKKHHPNGAPIIEEILPDYSEKDNPRYYYKLSTAIIEFMKLLNIKYKDKKIQTAVFMKVISEIYDLKNI